MLERPEQMLRLVLEAIPVAVHWKDLQSVYQGCNSRFARDAELECPEDIVGKTDFDLPWRQFAETYQRRDRQVMESGQPLLNYEQQRTSSTGRTCWLRQSKLPLRDARGRIIGVLTTYEDITASKQAAQALYESEARYRAVVENSPDGIAVSVEGKLVYVNPAAARLVAGGDVSQLLGRPVWDFIAEEHLQAFFERRELLLHTGRALPLLESKARHLDGTVLDTECTAAMVRFNGQPAVLLCFRDITKRKRAEAALAHSREELEERVRERTAELERANQHLRRRTAELRAANEQLEGFVSAVAHDLRAPLRAIDGFGRLLEGSREQLDAEAGRSLQGLRDATGRMSRFVEACLGLAQVTRRPLLREPVNLSQAARVIEAELRREQPGRNVEFITEPNLVVQGDPTLLHLVLQNLLGNAWKFASRVPRARIEFGREEQEGSFFVRDNGVGFSMESARKLFQPLERLPSADGFPGTGIGLATVQQIIRRHGGRIWADSALGQGATFHFTLA